MSEPTLKRKRSVSDAKTSQLDPSTSRIRDGIEQMMSPATMDMINARHIRCPPGFERREDDDLGSNYPTVLPSSGQASEVSSIRRLKTNRRLCKQCSNIDLDNLLLSRRHKTKAGQLVKNLRQTSPWEIDTCILCNLLSSSINIESWQRTPKMALRSYSSNTMGDVAWNSITTNVLQVGPNGRYLVSQPEGVLGPVKIIKQEIEEESFDMVKNWLKFCQNNHAKSCSTANRSSVPGLKLIDCHTRDIVPAQDKPYLALSYVWGLGSDVSINARKLPETLPNTIADAMLVSEKLGYRHIWIDRYCIDQTNDDEKADQCGKMDLIYQNADLTIIAAIGEDPSYGLPGVSVRKRKKENLTTCSKIGKHFLISAPALSEKNVKETKWITRGWTYQEGLLSRRRLVFEEEQMYFECYGMYCCESIHFPLGNMHRNDMQGFKRIFCSDELIRVFPKGVGTTSMDITRRIEEYSALNLTNPSDILRGMLGIFNAFQRSRLGIHHCFGIPILPSMVPNSTRMVKNWTPSMGFFFGLSWNLKARSERRLGFPSWSWTGWYGSVHWRGEYRVSNPVLDTDPAVKVSVELIDGRRLPWEEFQDMSTGQKLPGMSNIIHLKAWIVDFVIIEREQQRDMEKYKTSLKLEDGGTLDWVFHSYSKIKFRRGRACKGIILGFDRNENKRGPTILVVSEVKGTMERIGFGWVEQAYYKKWGKTGVWEFADDPADLWRNPDTLESFELVKKWEEVHLG